MLVTNEIASITISVPYQKGNEIVNQIVPFKVFKQQQHYRAIPLISAEERNIADSQLNSLLGLLKTE